MSVNQSKAEPRQLGRGTIYIPMDTTEGLADADSFVRIYEKYHGKKIADLDEVARARGIVESFRQ